MRILLDHVSPCPSRNAMSLTGTSSRERVRFHGIVPFGVWGFIHVDDSARWAVLAENPVRGCSDGCRLT